MTIHAILRMGDPRLLRVAPAVKEFGTPALRTLVADMFETMRSVNGAGLAAPQIGVDLALVIFGFKHNDRYPDAPPVPVLAPRTGGGGGPPAPYVQPAPWRQLTADDVVGVWLGFGVGMDKQYFVIRQDGSLGRTEVLIGTALSQNFGDNMITLLVRVPVYRHIVQGSEALGRLSSPVIASLIVSRSF